MLKVIAIGITPRIDEYERERLQEMLDGTHPMSSHRKTYDTGTKRKTVLDQSPAGPNETGGTGDSLSHDNVGSNGVGGPGGFLDPSGQADDEIGPGNTPKYNKEQTFTDPKTVELITMNDFDTSSSMSPLNAESAKWDKKTNNINLRLREIYKEPGVGGFPKRYPVDQLSRAASSTWSHKYCV